ncbi:hypothetical protein [Mucilaginibacter flavus]|uniref:hypothetical protein n=1 Tax=Mucilaginibacter flavus TaxID=931504 RepID=UPI0025B3D145|nr:hypothetical protein [Mucilaginibacter flavus]MDN3581808.1 hypothetical protein [Mucilaginibacter flavus]
MQQIRKHLLHPRKRLATIPLIFAMLFDTLPNHMNLSYRTAARAAIASGVAGIVAYVFLIGFLIVRSEDAQNGTMPIRVHDTFVILQFVFLIPVVVALFRLIQERLSGISALMLHIPITALCFTVLFLLLIFPKILADTLYMFPQGILGVWLVMACWRLKAIIPQWLRWFGIVVGFGLALVGLFPVGYAIFVDSVILHIPAPSDEVMAKIPAETPANILIHQILYIGSFMGVLMLPIWTILIGVRLFKKK